MFKNNIKSSSFTISEQLEKNFLFENRKTQCQSAKVTRLSWAELSSYGIVKEEKDQNEEITVIRRMFTAHDKSQWRSSEIIIPTEKYNQFIAFSNKGEITKAIADLELEIEVRIGYNDHETARSLQDQLKFIKEEYGIKN